MPTRLLGSMTWPRTSLPCSTGILSKTVAWSKKKVPFAPGWHFGEAQVEYWLDGALDDGLCDSIRHSRDGQCKLHWFTVRIWDGRRSAIHFIRFEDSALKC